MIKSSKSGFTLAEVLTTLMVIGVVAAMTIPTLMNSTQESQAKTAAKKASSILSQAIQMMQAQEVSCSVESDETLAGCMKNVLSGTLTGNTITTPDGFVYAFYSNNNVSSTSKKDILQACGQGFSDASGTGNCLVVVDTNGLSKGVTDAFEAKNAAVSSDTMETGTDRVEFMISSEGVRPVWFGTKDNYAYKYMFGSNPTTSPYTTKYCCAEDWIQCNGEKHADNTEYYCATGLTYTGTTNCPKTSSKMLAIDDTHKFVKSCTPKDEDE